VLRGLRQPTVVRFAPDGRVFVAEKRGTVVAFAHLDDPNPTVAVDLRERVYAFGDRGLLGMALAPGFPQDPHLYLAYTFDGPVGGTAPTWGDACPTPPGPTDDGCAASAVVSRVPIDAEGHAGPEQVLVHDWCQQFPSHSIGDLEFGPDGMLYVGGGDGASFTMADYGQAGAPPNPCGDPPVPVGGRQAPPTAEGGALRAQDLRSAGDPTTLSGTIARLHPATGAPVGGTGPDENARRIVASGLRNPFRLTFRPGTDELWVGDVGWTRFDEINRFSVGGPRPNFGWPCYEGHERQPAYGTVGLDLCAGLYRDGTATPPTFAYRFGQAVIPGDGCPTGGTAVSGLAFSDPAGSYPPVYDGALFWTDYSRRCIFVMLAGPDGRPNPTTLSVFARDVAEPVDLVTGPGGDLYYPSISTGTVRRIRHFAANVPPVASFTATPPGGPVPLQVTFDATGSLDPDGDALEYRWDLDGDGNFDDDAGPTAARTYPTPGSVTVGLRVTDARGASATTTRLVTPGNGPPTVRITSPASSVRWSVGDVITLAADAVDPEDGPLGPEALRWEATIEHCPTPATCHTHPFEEWMGRSGSLVAPDHEYPSHLAVRVTATDTGGQTGRAVLELAPRTATLTVRSEPPGLFCALGSGGAPTPFDVTVLRGSRTLVSVAPQRSTGLEFDFDSWSDGGAATHEVTVREDTTVTARLSPRLVGVDDVELVEGDAGTTWVEVPITLNRPATRPVRVRWGTGDGTAVSPGDYGGRSGEVVFLPGEVRTVVVVPVHANARPEPDRSFTVGLWTVTNATFGRQVGTVTILDDDGGALPAVLPGGATVGEGDDGRRVVEVGVRLDRPARAPVVATLADHALSATPGTDYERIAAEVRFEPGERQARVPVAVLGDRDREGDETFLVHLQAVEGGRVGGWGGVGLVVIEDDDPEPEVVIEARSVAEGHQGWRPVTLTVRLAARTVDAVTVAWATADVSARAGEDYRAAAGRLTVAPGRRRAEVRIWVRGDRWPERDETLRVALTAVAGARRAPAAKATLTIRNDDGPVYGVARR
jgi:glucose/arabinose dehydrogenase/PKD repeat protein